MATNLTVNTLRPEQNDQYLPENILKYIFLYKYMCILLQTSSMLIHGCFIYYNYYNSNWLKTTMAFNHNAFTTQQIVTGKQGVDS